MGVQACPLFAHFKWELCILVLTFIVRLPAPPCPDHVYMQLGYYLYYSQTEQCKGICWSESSLFAQSKSCDGCVGDPSRVTYASITRLLVKQHNLLYSIFVSVFAVHKSKGLKRLYGCLVWPGPSLLVHAICKLCRLVYLH